jgi:nucleotide-binding universal stress UspA family protein
VQKKIVVGYDGSSFSHAALAWALDEANRSAIPIELVYADEWPVLAPAAGLVPAPALRPESYVDEVITGTMNHAVAEAKRTHPLVDVSTTTVRAHAVAVLIERSLSRLILAAQRIQRRQPDVQREVAEWLRPVDGVHRDGVVVPPAAPGELGSRWSPRDRPAVLPAAAGSRAATIVLTTPGDDRVSWLRAGEALQQMLLLATCQGAHASFHTEVLEVPATRDALAAIVGGDYPQMVLRLGYAEDGAPAPRRPPAAVLTLPRGPGWTR